MMEFIGNNDPGIAHQLGHVRGLSARRRAKIKHGRIRSRCQNQRGNTGGERLRMNVAEEILQEFPQGQGPGSFIKGAVPQTDRPQGDSFLAKHPYEGSRGTLEKIHTKVIGKRPCVAFQKGIKVRNEIAVFFESLCHRRSGKTVSHSLLSPQSFISSLLYFPRR